MAIVALSRNQGHAGAALCITAAICAVTAGLEQLWAAAQEAAMWPSVLPVAEFSRPGATVPDAQLHWYWLRPSAKILFRLPKAPWRRRVQPHGGVKGEEVNLQDEN